MAKKLVQTAMLVTFLSVLARIFSFLFRIYLSRTIGAENLGIYQIALSIFFLFCTLTAGLPLTVSRKTAELSISPDKKAEKSLLSSALLVGISLSACIVALLYICRNSLSFLFSDQRCLPLFLILLPCCISTAIYGIIRGWFWGHKNFTVFSLTEFFECIVRITLGVLLVSGVVAGAGGAYGTALSFTIADVLCTVVLCILFVIYGGRLSRPNKVKEVLRTSTPLTAVRLYNSLINSLIAIIVPARLIACGMESNMAVSEFGRAMGMAIPLLMSPSTLTGAIATVLVPELAMLKAQGNSNELKRKAENSIVLSLLCAYLFVVIFLPLGKEIGILFYNDEKAGNYISLASFLMIPMSVSGITATMLDSLGLELKTMRNFILGSILMLAVLYITPQFCGVYSIAIGLSVSYLTSSTLNLISLKKELQISLRSTFEVLFAVGITVGVCSYGAVFIKNITQSLPIFLNICIPAIFSVAFFLLFTSLYGYVDISILKFRKKRKKKAKASA
ncbi:MAG: oligosaccharide flippase family protein [Clostridia bacterium]|nr:oligosaccharide flippase family protein [Clostridia bacterium]